jgi:hypothetical protein
VSLQLFDSAVGRSVLYRRIFLLPKHFPGQLQSLTAARAKRTMTPSKVGKKAAREKAIMKKM